MNNPQPSQRATGFTHAMHVLWHGERNRWEFTDDSGVTRPLWKPNALAPQGKAGGDLFTEDEYEHLRYRITRLSRRSMAARAVGVAVGLFAVFMILSAVAAGALGSSFEESAVAGILYLLFIVAAIVACTFVYRGLGGDPRVALRALREAGRCGCGHRIDSLEPDEDGMVTCPECGARWRVTPSSG